eukprot:gene1149-biopygen18
MDPCFLKNLRQTPRNGLSDQPICQPDQVRGFICKTVISQREITEDGLTDRLVIFELVRLILTIFLNHWTLKPSEFSPEPHSVIHRHQRSRFLACLRNHLPPGRFRQARKYHDQGYINPSGIQFELATGRWLLEGILKDLTSLPVIDHDSLGVIPHTRQLLILHTLRSERELLTVAMGTVRDIVRRAKELPLWGRRFLSPASKYESMKVSDHRAHWRSDVYISVLPGEPEESLVHGRVIWPRSTEKLSKDGHRLCILSVLGG